MNTESELESFRQKWREEVARRNNDQSTTLTQDSAAPHVLNDAEPHQRPNQLPPTHATQVGKDAESDREPQAYHDLDDKDDSLKLSSDSQSTQRLNREPQSALEHYERAVERETAGKLGDSVNLYRRAFKLDDGVHEAYKKKHFPPSAFPPKAANVSNSAAPAQPGKSSDRSSGESRSIHELVESFSTLSVLPEPPETDLSPPRSCPVSAMPEEILTLVFNHLAVDDVGAFSRLAQVCKRFAYLISTDDQLWKHVVFSCTYGFPSMRYLYTCDFRGNPLSSVIFSLCSPKALAHQVPDLTPTLYPTYRSQFRHRPRIRFNGCYYSTNNYQRQGASQHSQYTWTSNPIHIVTYYRYLRFFRDGTVISLQTTSEPVDVVPYLTKEHLHQRHTGGLPSAVMKEAKHGRWRLTGPASSQYPNEYCTELPTDKISLGRPGLYPKEPASLASGPPSQQQEEDEGTVHVETQGVGVKYMWKMVLTMSNSSRRDGTRNNKLSWRGHWSFNRLTDDWGEFGLKNDKPFYWARVKSYGAG